MPNENEDFEEVDIDDENNDSNDDSTDDQEEAPDRGDVVADPDADLDTDETGDEVDDETDGDETDGEETDEEDDSADEEGSSSGVPFSRVGQISQEKNAYKEINASLIDGSLDPRVVAALGGGDVVAKALAREEVTILGLKQYVIDDNKGQVKTDAQDDGVDISKKWEEYHSLNEDGAYDDARKLLAEIQVEQGKQTAKLVANTVNETMTKNRAEEKQRTELADATTVATEIKKSYPVLLDNKSPEYQEFTDLADFYHAKGVPLGKALQRAGKTLFGKPLSDDVDDGQDEINETKAKKTAADRKREAILRNAKAAKKQPPQLDKGSGHRKVSGERKVSDMSDDEFNNMSEAEKRRARGD